MCKWATREILWDVGITDDQVRLMDQKELDQRRDESLKQSRKILMGRREWPTCEGEPLEVMIWVDESKKVFTCIWCERCANKPPFVDDLSDEEKDYDDGEYDDE